MMNATLTAALGSVQLSAEERAARLRRLHFVATASFKALNESGGALVTAMLQAWPSYWNAVQAVAAAGALPIRACMPMYRYIIAAHQWYDHLTLRWNACMLCSQHDSFSLLSKFNGSQGHTRT